MSKIVLRYVGRGDFLPGVPARDLTADEVELHGGKAALVKSGLYTPVPGKPGPSEDKQAKPPVEDKAVTPESDDKES